MYFTEMLTHPSASTLNLIKILHYALKKFRIKTLAILLCSSNSFLFFFVYFQNHTFLLHFLLRTHFNRWHVPLEQSDMPKKLILPREACPTRAPPPGHSAMLEVAPKVSHQREVLLIAPVARIHLGAVAPLEVVLHARHRLEWSELLVRPVPVAPGIRAREPNSSPGYRLPAIRRANFPVRLREGFQGLEPVAVSSHVHPEVRVTLETLAADLAEVDMFRQKLCSIDLHYVVLLPDRRRRIRGRRLGSVSELDGRRTTGSGLGEARGHCISRGGTTSGSEGGGGIKRLGGGEKSGAVEDDPLDGRGDMGGDHL